MGMSLDLIGITAANIGESLRFYRLLDIEIAEPAQGDDHVETVLPNGLRMAGDSLELTKQIDSDWVAPVGRRMGLAFLCENPGAVDAAYNRILGAGFEGRREPWDAFWGQRYAQVVDPDGNSVDLFTPLG
jgi:uncharacterized glyoxalase superfamily protein PhnB